MKKIISIILIMIFILSCNTVYAGIEYTESEKKYLENDKKVYVAGNEYSEIIEKFEKGNYKGILPDIFKKITEKSGIEFEYINKGQDWNEYEKNNQIEIISGITENDIKDINIKEKLRIINIPTNDGNIDIYIGFTEIADDNLISIINKIFDEIQKEEIENIILSNVINNKKDIKNKKLIMINIISIITSIIVLIIMYKKSKKEINNERYIDNITETFNYKWLEEKYNKNITDDIRCAYSVINLGLYLDYIEELYGYYEVESILKKASRILKRNLEKDEMYARLYKDTFVIFSKYESNKNMNKKIKYIIRQIKDYIKQDNKIYELKINAGVYNLKQTDRDLRKAVYYSMQARKDIKNKSDEVKICSDALVMKINKNINIERDILEALNNNEFCAYVQPLLNPDKNDFDELEVLARWDSPKYGLIRPGTFIQILEKNNYMKKLDYFMYEIACKKLSELKNNDKELVTMFCNFSLTTLEDTNFYDDLEIISKKYQIPEKYIGIKIEKNTFDKGLQNTKYIIEKLKNKGYTVLLNDFESLSYSLKGINSDMIDYIKVSSKLTEDLSSPQSIAILKGIIDTVHSLGIKVICEDYGKEKNEKILKELGCDRLQGYIYYQPVPIKEFINLK